MTKHAYATSEDAATVTIIDLDERRAVAALPAGPGAHSLALTPDGSRAYVANRRDRTLTVVDTRAMAVIGTIELSSSPTGVAVSPDGGSLAVLGRARLVAWIVDVAAGRVRHEIALGEKPEGGTEPADAPPFSTHPVWLPDGSGFYAEDNVHASLARVDAARGAVAATVALPSPAHMVYVEPADSRIYALCVGDSATGVPAAVAVIDAATDTLLRVLPVPLAPRETGELHHGSFDASGDRFFVANMGEGRPRGGHSVHVLDTNQLTFTGRMEARAGAGHPVLSPDGTRLYVVNHSNPIISVFDVESLKAVGEIELPDARSMGHGCLFTESGDYFWALSNSAGAAYAVDTQSLTVVARVETGTGTQEIARTWQDAYA